MTKVLGLDAKLYYKVGGKDAGGSWIELTNVSNVTITPEMGKADLSTRGSGGVRAQVPTLMDLKFDFEMVWDTEDTGFQAIRDAFLNRELIGLAALDGPDDSGEGPVINAHIFTFARSEQLTEGLKVNVSAEVGYSSSPPEWTEDGL